MSHQRFKHISLRAALSQRSRQEICRQVAGGTKMKCQRICKIPCQIPLFGSVEAGSQRGDCWRSGVHMQLFPPLLMQGVLHCNPFASGGCVQGEAVRNLHANTHPRLSMHGSQCTKLQIYAFCFFTPLFSHLPVHKKESKYKPKRQNLQFGSLCSLWMNKHKEITWVYLKN